MKIKQDRRNKIWDLFATLRSPFDARSRAQYVITKTRSQRERDELEALVQALYEQALEHIEEGVEREYVEFKNE